MYSPSLNPELIRLLYIMGRCARLALRSIHNVQHGHRKRPRRRREPITYREYHEMKLTALVKDNTNLPQDIARTIARTTNGQHHKCATCMTRIMLFSDTKWKFDRHELSRNNFTLLSDNNTLVCKACESRVRKCYRCGNSAYRTHSLQSSLCFTCKCELFLVLLTASVLA